MCSDPRILKKFEGFAILRMEKELKVIVSAILMIVLSL